VEQSVDQRRDGGSVSSVRRTIQVMDLLARKGAVGVRAVAQQLDLPVGSVHRLLLDLAEEHAVERTADGTWQLGYRLLEITHEQLEGVGLPRLARPFCEDLAEQTGETVNLNVISGDACVCIDRVRGSDGMQLDWRMGSPAPLYAGGSAKAMLAFVSEAEQVRVANAPKTRFTQHTLTDASALLVELRGIRQRGYAVDDQELVLGVFCVGVPILDRLGRPAGAMSISGPSPKSVGASVEPLVRRLSDACGQISKRLGYIGPWPPRDVVASAAMAAH
jgi:DNA-binding IclR family transcriptional regulator